MTKPKTKKTAAKAKPGKKVQTKPVTFDGLAVQLDKACAETPLQIKRSGSKVQEKTADGRQSAYHPDFNKTALPLPDTCALLRACAYALETDTMRKTFAYSGGASYREYLPLLRSGDVLSVRISDTATAALSFPYSALKFTIPADCTTKSADA